MHVVIPKEVVQNVLKFLERVQLQGIETPMFMNCVTQLQKAPDFADLTAKLGLTAGDKEKATEGTPAAVKPSKRILRKKEVTSETSSLP